jgi:phage shock protein PspC (stress-responsive transcriptional regulator)
MKKALKVNLSGLIFHIDEDAYEKLRIYLDTISRHFSNAQESKEIIDDIETRIAELFTEKLKDGSQVITIKLVDEIIDIMGRPEEIVSDEEPAERKESGYRAQKRLYRDPDNAVIGGVSAGLGAYLNIDILLIRVLFIVLTLIGAGFPIILYLVLWIAVPKAKTATERLEMKGEEINVSNIEKTVREEYENVKQNLKNAKNSDAYRRTEGFFQEFIRIVGAIIVAFFKIILIIIGVGFVIAGLGLLIGFVGLMFFGVHFLPFEAYHSMKLDAISPFISPGNLSLLAISITLLIAIPVLSIVYALFKAIFRFKANNKALGLSAFALWVLALVAAISLLVFEAREFSESEALSNTSELALSNSNILYLNMNDGPDDIVSPKQSFQIDKYHYYFQKEGNMYGRVKVGIRKSTSEKFEIKVEKGAKGFDHDIAESNAESIIYNYNISGNTLYLSPWFTIPSGEKWRLQYVELTIYVPEGDTIEIESTLSKHLEGIYNTEGYSSARMAGNTWVMGERGLSLVEK